MNPIHHKMKTKKYVTICFHTKDWTYKIKNLKIYMQLYIIWSFITKQLSFTNMLNLYSNYFTEKFYLPRSKLSPNWGAQSW
jgi:hypothetical protein